MSTSRRSPAPATNEKPPFDKVGPMVNRLDKAIVQASKSDQKSCDGVKVLHGIVELTLDIYHFCQPWGIYTFPFTNRVYAWFQYIVEHEHLISDENASMDWAFFLDPVFSPTRHDIEGTDGPEEVDEEGNGDSDTGEEEDVSPESMEVDEEKDGDGGVEGGVDVTGDGGSAGKAGGTAVNGDGGPAGRKKRKSSNPVPSGSNQPVTTKRSRTGTRGEATPDDGSGNERALRDKSSGPGLKRYAVSCARCALNSTVCYMQSGNTKKAKACDQCRKLKRPCSYGDNDWVSSLPQAAKDRVEEEWKESADRWAVANGKKKATSKGGKKRLPEAKESTSERKVGQAMATVKTGEKDGGPVTRSKNKETPQPPATPSHPVYSLGGSMVGTHATVIQPPAVTRTLSVPPAPSRQPSPKAAVIDGTSQNIDRAVADLTTLLESSTRLDGQVADVQGQIRALNREVESFDALREEMAELRGRQDDIRGEIEDLDDSTRSRFQTINTLIQTMDPRTRMDILQQTTERDLRDLVIAREDLERGHSVMKERLEGLVARVDGLDGSVASVRRDAVEGNGERIGRIERTLGTVQDDVRRTKEQVGLGGGTLADALDAALRRHEERMGPRLYAIEQHLQTLDQRFNAVAVMLTQQAGHSPSYIVARPPDSTVSPKAIFPPLASSSTHFVAEVPRELPGSGSLPYPHATWTTPPSDIARRYTHFSTLSAASGASGHPNRSTNTSLATGMEAPWMNLAHDRISDVSGEIIPPPGFTGGKSGRRPEGLAAPQPHTRDESPSTHSAVAEGHRPM